MTELIFQKGLMLIKQIYQKNVIFVTIMGNYLCVYIVMDDYLCLFLINA